MKKAEPVRHNKHYQIAVIGHLVRDRIRLADNSFTEALGGIAYSIASLATVAGDGTKVMPVCRVGEDLYAEAGYFFAKFKVVDFSLVKKLRRKNGKG